MTTLLLNFMLFVLRFAEDPPFALQVLKSPKAKMDVTSVSPKVISLPVAVLPESSGLETAAGKSNLFSHNDSGGKTELYETDTLGNLIQTISIPGVVNKDWEDLAQDEDKKVLFIGDFGNNANKRKDLKIYKVENLNDTSTIQTSVINFYYPDQQFFPPAQSNMNFDCEAFFCSNDSLYLFSKNRFAGNGFTKLYRLPAKAGNYKADLLDSFFLNNVVTAADISPDKSKIALLSYGAVYIFSDFRNNDFFSGNLLKVNIPISQSEGIVFYNNNTIYYSAEDGFLQKIELAQLKITKRTSREKYSEPEVKIVNNQRRGTLKFKIKEKDFKKFSVSVFSPDNKEIITKKEFTKPKLNLEIKDLPAGIYNIKIFSESVLKKNYPLRIR